MNSGIIAAVCAAATLVTGCGGRTRADGEVTPGSEVCHLGVSWERRFATEPGVILQHAVATQGGWVLAGRHLDGGTERTVLMALSATGDTRWQQVLEGRSPQLARVGDGVVVARELKGDVVLTRFDEAGAPEFELAVGTDDDDAVTSLVSTGNDVTVFGDVSAYPGSSKGLFATSVSGQGAKHWEVTWPAAKGLELRAISAHAAASGSVWIAAQRWVNGGGGPPWVAALGATGGVSHEWTDSVHHERGGGFHLLPLRDGGALLTGTTESDSAGGPVRATRFGAAGGVVWTRSFDDGSGNQQLVHDGVELASGGFAFVGYSANVAKARLWRVRADGTIASIRDYDDFAAGLLRVTEWPAGGLVIGRSKWGFDEDDVIEVLQLDAKGEIVARHSALGEGVASFGDLVTGPADGMLAVGGWYADALKQTHVLQLGPVCED